MYSSPVLHPLYCLWDDRFSGCTSLFESLSLRLSHTCSSRQLSASSKVVVDSFLLLFFVFLLNVVGVFYHPSGSLVSRGPMFSTSESHFMVP